MPATPSLPSQFTSLAQVAARLCASRRSARRWLDDAKIPAFVFGKGRNGSVRFPADAVERWLLTRKERT